MDAVFLGLGGARESVLGNGSGGTVPPRAHLRLTRRGRMVVIALLATLAAVVFVLVAQPGRAADPPSPPPTIVVTEGDTLWSIAGRYSPGRERAATIEDIRRLNHLDGYSLRAGQRLVLPRRR